MSITQLKKIINNLDPFEDLEKIEKLEEKIINMLYKKINNKTAKFQVHNGYYILHKSTKKDNTIQVSFFCNDNIAISDAEYNNYKDALKDLLYYELAEVV